MTHLPRLTLAMLASLSMAAVAADAPAMLSSGALVAANGMTLYSFDMDTPGSGKSACNGPCAALWPPLQAAPNAQADAAYSIVMREDGARQWAYKGKPVYTYRADQKAGERSGDNFKGVWHIIKE